MKKSCIYYLTYVLVGVFTISLSTLAQEHAPDQQTQGSQYIEPAEDTQSSDTVTINVKDANISEVLKAYSLQTGQSIVVGPDVVSDNVNVRLNNIPWQEALDVILKPYGFGYRVLGGTIVISRLENIIEVEGIEPLVSKVFNLKFIDAYDIKAVVEAQLTGRGKFTILSTTGLPGWEFGGQESSRTGGAATEGGIRRRKEKEQIQKSKTFVITDVPSNVSAIGEIIDEMDVLPSQILIEAQFLEINTGGLTDIGLDYITAVENTIPLATGGGSLEPSALSDSINRILNTTTGYVDPLDMGAAGSLSQANGLRLASTEIGGNSYDMLFALIAKDEDANVLSAPRILTVNNQEAAILVGEKFPIIESQNNSGGGSSSTTSTSLDYYENIGIQLNVIPQVCADDYVNMIVHPAVSEIKGYESGTVFSGGESASGTRYPVLKIREAETQVQIQSGNTAVIGGLQTERDKELIEKIPFLGDIPYVGRLFRRETNTKEKIDLLIFIKATIIDEKGYASDSLKQQQEKAAAMGLDLMEEEAAAVEGTAVAPEKDTDVIVTGAVDMTEVVDGVKNDEIVAYVSSESAEG